MREQLVGTAPLARRHSALFGAWPVDVIKPHSKLDPGEHAFLPINAA